MSKIALIVDSFNPFNNTHIELAKKVLEQLNANEVWFVSLDDQQNSEQSFRDNIINIHIKPYRKFKLYSSKSYDFLETLEDLPKVNDYCLIKTSYVIDIYGKKKLKELMQVEKIKVKLADQHRIRNGDFTLLTDEAKTYIIESGVYAHSILKNMVNEKRYNHSVSVANLAKEIAESNGLDGFKAYLAGIYHDLAKGLSKNELADYMALNKPYEQQYDWHVWHQYVAMHLLKNEYNMQDEIILNAVRHHCLGDSDEVYAKIIFMADKYDPLRGYDSSKQIALAKKDVHKAFIECKIEQGKYLDETGVIR